MLSIRLTVLALMFIVLGRNAFGVTAEEFKAVYDSLQRFTLDRSGEVAQIDSFTYVKDVATFRFGKGTMLLQRPVHGRPTLAAFVGTGHLHIDIPPLVEREAYRGLTGDSCLDEDFEVLVLRIGDDFDVEIRKIVTFHPDNMSTAEYSRVRDAQQEYYFKPTLFDLYDNLAQLAVSTYERQADGYFWAGFNNKVFSFDPNRPEEVSIANPKGPYVALGDLGPRFQRQDRILYETTQMSEMKFPTSVLSQDAKLELSGADGWTIASAEIRTELQVDADSLRFVRLFLDKHFQPDSIYCNGSRIDWYRRSEFFHMEILLPEYARKGDRLSFTLWFHNAGNRYSVILPFVDNPGLFPSTVHLIYPNGYNYAVPGRLSLPDLPDKRSQCKAGPFDSKGLWFMPLPIGYDTTTQLVNDRLSLTFIRAKSETYLKGKAEDTTVDACRYFHDLFGPPSQMSEWYVVPGAEGISLGMFGFPLTRGDIHAAGLHGVVSNAAANAWFGPAVQYFSYREQWMTWAVPEYLSLLYSQKRTGNAILYGELETCKRILDEAKGQKVDVPLALGGRASSSQMVARGVPLLHMLRVLMFDTDKLSDDKFFGFMKALVAQANRQSLSNHDFCQLAETYFGAALDWFFEPWLYKKGMPSFDVAWKATKEDSGYFLDMRIVTSDVDTNCVYPILCKVVVPSGSALLRQAVAGTQQEYRFGPFSAAPTDLKFNFYESVLCKQKVRKL